MISLTFLSLKDFAKEHHGHLHQKTKDRFDLIFIYFHTLLALQTESAYPETQILAALPLIRESSRKEITPQKTDFPNIGLYNDCLSILDILKIEFDSTLKGTPDQIDTLVNKLRPLFSKYQMTGDRFGYMAKFKHFINALKFIWDYDDFTKKQTNPSTYDGYTLAKKLGVPSCPYCNRSYTFTVINTDNTGKNPKSIKIVRPEFDHFYSKSRYPFLNIAFYNLVPSCYICNSTLKGDIEMNVKDHCHPYVEGYEDIFYFQTGVTVRDYLDKGKPPLLVSFIANPKANANHVSRAAATNAIFGIGDIYPHHADIAGDLFLKSIEESKSTIEGYWNQVSKGGKYLFDEKADVYRHFIGNFYTKKEFYKRPLSKFHHDILKETNLLKYIKGLPVRPDPSKAVPVNAK